MGTESGPTPQDASRGFDAPHKDGGLGSRPRGGRGGSHARDGKRGLKREPPDSLRAGQGWVKGNRAEREAGGDRMPWIIFGPKGYRGNVLAVTAPDHTWHGASPLV